MRLPAVRLQRCCFELLKWLFPIYPQSVSFRHIYGAMAIVPITLVWLYAVWLVVLFGASFTACIFRFPVSSEGRASCQRARFLLGAAPGRTLPARPRERHEHLPFNGLSQLEPNIAEPMLRSYLAGMAGIGLIESDSHDHWWLSGPLSGFTLKDLHQGLGLVIPVEHINLPSQDDDIDACILPIIEVLRGSLKTPLERPLSQCFPEAPRMIKTSFLTALLVLGLAACSDKPAPAPAFKATDGNGPKLRPLLS